MFMSLLFSLALFCLAKSAIESWPIPVLSFFSIYLLFAFGPLFIMVAILTPVMWQGALLTVLVGILTIPRRRPEWYVRSGLSVTVGVYAVIGVVAWCETASILAKFPAESVEDRLPPPRIASSSISDFSEIDRLEGTLYDSVSKSFQPGMGFRTRSEDLQFLHQRTILAFITRPGFGVTRMFGDPLHNLAREKQETTPSAGNFSVWPESNPDT